MATAVMREDDQRPVSGMGRRVTDSHLLSWRFPQGHRESILRFRRKILPCVLHGGWIPDLTREWPVSGLVEGLNRADTNGKSSTGKWIVRCGCVAEFRILHRLLHVFIAFISLRAAS